MPVFLELIHPDVEWVPLRAVLDGDVYRGHEGIHHFIADMDEDIEHMQVRVDDVLEVGENVVVHGAIVGKGRGSGMDLDLELGWVLHAREGRVDYLRAFSDRADALKAAEAAREGVELPLGPPSPALDS